MKSRMKWFLLGLLLLLISVSVKSTYCDELTKEVNFSKDYTYCTFTVSGDNLDSCTGYVISPNGGMYALSYIDGYMVTTIERCESGSWTVKLTSESAVPNFKVSVSTNNLVTQGTDVVDTTIAKKVTGLSAYMEDDTIKLTWTHDADESVYVDFYNAVTLEALESNTNGVGSCEFVVPKEVDKVIVKCVYYRYRAYDNAYTSYVFDKAELPVATISFDCPDRTNVVSTECSVNSVYPYVIYNNGDVTKNTISLTEGLNHVIVKVTSEKGYVKNYEYNIIKDTKPPVISLSTDINQTETTYEQMQISGTVIDAVSLMVQGNYVTFTDEGYFEATLKYNVGSNEVVIKATDDTGNTTEYIAYVTRYEPKKGINSAFIVLILAIISIVGLVFYGRRTFKKNMAMELGKKEKELDETKNDLEEERYKATHDELTKCKNRTGYMKDLKNFDITNLCVINFDVNNLKWTNDNLGHQSGDKLLLTITQALQEHYENVYRMGGDEFAVLLDKHEFDKEVLAEIDNFLEAKTKADKDNIIYQVAYGYDFGDGVKTEKQISFNADQLMYENKAYKKSLLAEKKEDLHKSGFSFDAISQLLKKHEQEEERKEAMKPKLVSAKKASETDAKEDVTDTSEKKNTFAKSLVSYIPYLVILVVLYVLLNKIYFVGSVQSDSMYPTMKTGDMIVGSRIYYNHNDFNRGDKIFFLSDGRYLSKRVIGIAGDEISFKNGYVVLNGEVIKEEYLSDDVETVGVKTYVVPENCVFVMGDNRSNSLDSRYWDDPYLSATAVVGRVFYVIPHKYTIPIRLVLILGATALVVGAIVNEIGKNKKKK